MFVRRKPFLVSDDRYADIVAAPLVSTQRFYVDRIDLHRFCQGAHPRSIASERDRRTQCVDYKSDCHYVDYTSASYRPAYTRNDSTCANVRDHRLQARLEKYQGSQMQRTTSLLFPERSFLMNSGVISMNSFRLIPTCKFLRQSR